MRRIFDQNYYELLDIYPNATTDEIRRAYRVMKEAFQEDSLAIYSLYDSSALNQIQRRLDDAHRTLLDEEERAVYDSTLSPSPKEGKVEESSTLPQQIPIEVNTSSGNGTPATDAELEIFLNNIGETCTGRLLKRFRESQGISLEWVAGKTRINITYLNFIESDNHAGLPHWVYLKSYLFQYAEFLGIDPNQVVDGFLKNCTPKH